MEPLQFRFERQLERLPNHPEDNRLYTVVGRFEWDPLKAAANLRTHRVSFAEAVTVLEDDFALTREDLIERLFGR